MVIGVVDSGIAPDSPAFADVPGLGRDPQDFAGECAEGDGWSADDCTRKVVGARWFAAGFGTDRVRSSESLSARDVLGHGTQVSSVAAGNAGVSVRVDGRDAGRFGGVAPQARIAAYKACWGAPDPADDGCSTADVVAAVDAAVGDRVDVLNLALAGGDGIDTLQRALLGAAEADIVVIGAAGNSGGTSYAAHGSPWVTTVGSAVGRMSRGRVTGPGGRSFTGGGRPAAVRGRVVLAQDAAAPGVSRRAAGQCRSGSLDSRKVARPHRGVPARRHRPDRQVRQRRPRGRPRDGAGQPAPGIRHGRLPLRPHRPPVRGRRPEPHPLGGRAPRRPGADVPRGRRPRHPAYGSRGARRATRADRRSSPTRSPTVTPSSAPCPDATGRTWGVFSGSSAATAHASGLAALVLAEHDWSAAVVRSLVAGSARPIPGSSVLAQGAGALPSRAPTAHLALDVPARAWRHALRRHTLADLNTGSLLLSARRGTAVRTLTNVGTRPEYFSVTARGFTSHRVSIQPLAVRLAPGQSARFTITVTGPTHARQARRRRARVARRPRRPHPGPGRADPLSHERALVRPRG